MSNERQGCIFGLVSMFTDLFHKEDSGIQFVANEDEVLPESKEVRNAQSDEIGFDPEKAKLIAAAAAKKASEPNEHMWT